MEVKIVREPKGGPDIIFIGTPEMEQRLLLAGDHLSVRGYTARVVTLPEATTKLDALCGDERARALAGGVPFLCIPESESLRSAAATEIAAAALQEIQA